VLCFTCAAACPHRSVQLRLRPPAADLQRGMDPPAGENGLILVLAGGIALHHWQWLLGWLPLAPASLQAGPLLPRLTCAGLALALPALGWLGLRRLPGALAALPYMLLPVSFSWPALPHWQADPHVLAFCQSAAVVAGALGTALLIPRFQPGGWRRWGTMALAVVLAAAGRWLVVA
jgi:hypothetical protein